MKDGFIEQQWRIMRWIWIVSLIAAPAIVLLNFSAAYSAGKPLPWLEIPLAAGIVLWGTAIMWIARRWFNFMLGREACKWRKSS